MTRSPRQPTPDASGELEFIWYRKCNKTLTWRWWWNCDGSKLAHYNHRRHLWRRTVFCARRHARTHVSIATTLAIIWWKIWKMWAIQSSDPNYKYHPTLHVYSESTPACHLLFSLQTRDKMRSREPEKAFPAQSKQVPLSDWWGLQHLTACENFVVRVGIQLGY